MDHKTVFEQAGLLKADARIETPEQEELVMRSLGVLLAEVTELVDRRISSALDEKPLAAAETELFSGLKAAFDSDALPAPETLCRLLQMRSALRENTPSDGCVAGALKLLSARGSGVDETDGLWLGMAAYFVYKTYPFAYAALRLRMRIVADKFRKDAYIKSAKHKLGSLSDIAVEITRETGRHGETETQRRIDTAFANAVALIDGLHEVPDLMPHFERFERLGGCIRYESFGVSRSDMKDALVWGKELSGLSGMTTLLSDMGRLKEAAADSVLP